MLISKYRWLWLIAVLLACVALYWPGMHGPFLFDDFPNLAALTSINHVDSWRDLGIYLSQPRSFPGRPLAMLSFLLQKPSWPENPFPFHLVNLGIHLLCGLLVYRLTRVLATHYLPERGTLSVTSDSRITLIALLAMTAWLINPIHVPGVMLVVQRMTLLMALFVLLGLLAYLKGLKDERSSGLRRGTWMMLGLGICMMLAFLSKENGILLPLYALVLDVTVMRTLVARLPARLQWWRRLLIWPVVLFVFAYLLINIPHFAQAKSVRDFTLGQRLMTEPRILFDYLSNIFLPRFGQYGLYHDGYPISYGIFSPWATLPAIVGIVGAAIFGLSACRRWPLVSLAILWYLGGQLIESSTVMLELYFDHRNYTPIVGPFVALAIGFGGIRNELVRKRLLVVVSLWLAASAFTTALSTRLYRSEDLLVTFWAAEQPDSIRAQTMLASRLYLHGQLEKAFTAITAISAKYPDNAGLAENRTYLECMQGRLTQGDMRNLTRLLHTAPFDRSGYTNISTLRFLASTHRCAALNGQSWQQLVHALLSNSHYVDGVSRGFLHYQLHDFAVAHGNLEEAVTQLDDTYAADPSANIPRLQAKYLASAGLYDQAIKILQDTDYRRLPLLRRLLVNDHAINAEAIKMIRQQQTVAAAAKADMKTRHGSKVLP